MVTISIVLAEKCVDPGSRALVDLARAAARLAAAEAFASEHAGGVRVERLGDDLALLAAILVALAYAALLGGFHGLAPEAGGLVHHGLLALRIRVDYVAGARRSEQAHDGQRWLVAEVGRIGLLLRRVCRLVKDVHHLVLTAILVVVSLILLVVDIATAASIVEGGHDFGQGVLVHAGLALDLLVDVGSCPFALGFGLRGDFPVLQAYCHRTLLHSSRHSFSSLWLLLRLVWIGLWCWHRYHLLIYVLVNLLCLSESPDG